MKIQWLVLAAVFNGPFLFAQFGNQQIISTSTAKPYLSIPCDVDGKYMEIPLIFYR